MNYFKLNPIPDLSLIAVAALLRKIVSCSRGDICVITPAKAGKIGVIWSDRPLLIWHGNIRKIEVHPRSNKQAL